MDYEASGVQREVLPNNMWFRMSGTARYCGGKPL